MLDRIGDRPLTMVRALPLYHIFALTLCFMMGARFGGKEPADSQPARYRRLGGVLECAAVGVQDFKSGEAVKLFVVKKDPTLSEEDLSDYCKEKFTDYKRPKYSKRPAIPS
ncbi:MAG: hypothetical protein H0W40_17275 [Methylibium sp.]|uniref:AMP-binding enzyme n=1 Tax=Methylibium sp. TaxID=2067992 RepID=UPI0017DEEC40|nr:hypothetical protein [Methylibium sp.]MBA3599104.1 hypothetical protein [Methylibium sp.]